MILNYTCKAMHADYEYRYFDGYPPVINHKNETQFLLQVAKQVPSIEQVSICEPFMIGEDFGYYMQHVPDHFSLQELKILNGIKHIHTTMHALISMSEQ